jgi:hypothetical protein
VRFPARSVSRCYCRIAVTTFAPHEVPVSGRPADNGLAQIEIEANRLEQLLDAAGGGEVEWKVWDKPGDE